MSDVLLALASSWAGHASDVVLTLILPRAPRRSGPVHRWWSARAGVFILISRWEELRDQRRILAPTAPWPWFAQLLYWAGGSSWATPSCCSRSCTTWVTPSAKRRRRCSRWAPSPSAGQPTSPSTSPRRHVAVIVALQIAYLPPCNSAFNKREGLVTMRSRAACRRGGQSCWPATSWWASPTPWRALRRLGEWGPTSREPHHLPGHAAVSARPNRGLLGDRAHRRARRVCAAPRPVSPGPPPQARLCLRMGFRLQPDRATSGWHPDPDPDPTAPSISASMTSPSAACSPSGFPLERFGRGCLARLPRWRINYETTPIAWLTT